MGKIPCFLPDKQGTLHTRSKMYPQSLLRAPLFFKALRMECLFYCGVGWMFDGKRLGFLSIQVLEWYLWKRTRPSLGPCSLTGNLGES